MVFMESFAVSAADSNTYELTLTEEPEEPDYPINLPPNKHRMPPKPIYCTITSDGIIISSTNADDIGTYEVFDIDGVCVAIFENEQDFISYIFSTSGTIEIRFHLDEYVLHGYLSL